MRDNSEHSPPAPQSRAQQEAYAAANATNKEARLAHEKLAELHREKDRDPAGPANSARLS